MAYPHLLDTRSCHKCETTHLTYVTFLWHCHVIMCTITKMNSKFDFFFFLNRSKSRRAALASCKSGSALIQKMDYHENRSCDTDHVIPSVERIMWHKSNMKPYSKISFEMCEIVKIENSSVHMVLTYINFFMAMLPLSFWLFTNKLE